MTVVNFEIHQYSCFWYLIVNISTRIVNVIWIWTLFCNILTLTYGPHKSCRSSEYPFYIFFQNLQLANYLLSIHHMINCFLRGLKSHFCLFLVDKWESSKGCHVPGRISFRVIIFGECLPIIIVKLNRKLDFIVCTLYT